MASILSLPNELLSQIANNLTRPADCHNLALSSHRLAAVAIPVIHKLAVQDKNGLTALQWAIWPDFQGRGRSDEYLVRVLLAKGVDVDYYHPSDGSSRCWSAIQLAVLFEECAILRILLQHGANPNMSNPSFGTPLTLAFTSKKWDAAIILLEHDADISPIYFKADIWSLPYALVALMIERGVDVNNQDKDGLTPLHWAIKSDRSYPSHLRISLVNLLLRSGADVSTQDSDGRTPLHYAARSETNVIQLLLDAGADVNTEDRFGYTPLFMAAFRLSEMAITCLLAAGANIISTRASTDAVNGALLSFHDCRKIINSPLHLRFYIKYVENSNLFSYYYRTKAAHRTILAGHDAIKPSGLVCANILHLLLANPLQMTRYIQREPGGGGVMCWAAEADCDDLVGLLLDSGADITAQLVARHISWLGDIEATALHWAAKSGSKKVVRLLLARGADILLKANADDKTAFRWARLYMKSEIAKGIICKVMQDASWDWRGRNRVGVWFDRYRARF